MPTLTKKDLEDIRKALEKIKNDPKAQENIRNKLKETAAIIEENKRQRRLTPKDWKDRITI